MKARRTALFVAILLGTCLLATAQDMVPLVAGSSGFVTTVQHGEQDLVSSANPILLLPLGRRWLVETEGELVGDFHHHDGRWENGFDSSLEYGQLDFIANRYVTVVAGRFLNPFGIFNERLHPTWIRKLQPEPLIHDIEAGSGNGGMLRGALRLGSGLDLNYATYFSASTNINRIEATRSTGSRLGLFLLGPRLEIGGSVQRQLQGERMKIYGIDATWEPELVPFELRSEYARSHDGSGYWLEGAYGLLRKHEVVARMEQFFTGGPPLVGVSMPMGGHGALPGADTRRALLGWNYYVNDGFKLSFAYGRQFSSEGNSNVWSLGIAYRLLFPLAPAKRERAKSEGLHQERANRRKDSAENPTADSVSTVAARGEMPKFAVDPAFAYRVNCTRCHGEPRKLADGEMASIMRHMRIRANLTADETEAILYYLTK